MENKVTFQYYVHVYYLTFIPFYCIFIHLFSFMAASVSINSVLSSQVLQESPRAKFGWSWFNHYSSVHA